MFYLLRMKIFADPNSLWFTHIGKDGLSYFLDCWKNRKTSLPQRS